MAESLEGLKGIIVAANNMLVYRTGNNDEEASIDHDKKLEALLLRCQERHLKINKDKMKLRQSEIQYIGHKITKDGVLPDENKIKAITEMKSPENVKSLKRFLGMINYLSKFMPRLTDETKIVRDLERKAAVGYKQQTMNNNFKN